MQSVSNFLRAPGRIPALVVLALAVAAYWADPYLLRETRDRGFDAMQRLWPLRLEQALVPIVDIDEESLRQLGQWPWPRTLVAQLVERIAACKPLALGVDIIFAEPDRLSPPLIAKSIPDLPPAVSAALSQMPPNEEKLAQAFARVPTVLGMLASAEVSQTDSAELGRTAVIVKGEAPNRFLLAPPATIHSLPEIVRAARSEGSTGAGIDEDAIVRSMPLISLMQKRLAPSLAVELLRVAAGAPAVVVATGRTGVTNVTVGEFTVPTDASARAYLHFEKELPRFISAADLFAVDFDRSVLEGKIVLLGVTALGAVDQKNTPLGPIQGVELHAQLIESIIGHSLLIRHPSARWIELALIVVPGLAVIGLLPYQRRPFAAAAGMLAIALVLVGAEFGLFRFAGWLLGTFYAAAVVLVAYATMLGGNYIASKREERRLQAELEREREAKARIEGELTAAHAIQMGLLPLHFPAFPDRHEIDLYARLVPARDVGGDLFDFLLIDHDHLFFMIGDVSGKGIPAAVFMAMTKEVVRDAAVRHGAALDRVLAEANAKIGAASANMAEDGANMMFVTAFAGLLNVTNGDLVYSSAGHDSPLVMADGQQLRELATEGGPPLGVLDDFRYPLSRDRLETNAILVLYTDGVTEAQNVSGTLYGSRRLSEFLGRIHPSNAQVATDLVFDDLHRFVGAAEPADDITVLALRRLSASH